MSALKPGTRCVIVGGCPENIGMIVDVTRHLGQYLERADAYLIETVTGRRFNQLWDGNELLRGDSIEAITDRHKLRPLLNLKEDLGELCVESELANALG